MSKIFEDNSLTIGHTPLVRLNRIGNGRILAKVESRNPSFSVKCRIGANMIWDAEKRGVLKPGVELVEPTSGNTGIALAYVAAARGYKLTLTMPETMSIERRKLLKALGANLVLTEGAKGMKGAIQKAEEIVASDPEKFLLLQQFSNPANPEIHEKTTGPEIWEDTDGQVDVFISGVGTGGTLTGVTRYIKGTKGKTDLITVAVEPTDSPVIAQALAGEELGLFARTGQLSLKASEGPVEMQAQNGRMQLFAEKKLTLSSASDITFAGKKRITLIGGGSYLRLEAGKVEYGTTATYLRRVRRTMKTGPASLPLNLPLMPLVDLFTSRLANPPAGASQEQDKPQEQDKTKLKPVLRISDAPGINGVVQPGCKWQIVLADSYMQAVTTDEVLMNGQSDSEGQVLQSEDQQYQLTELAKQYANQLWLVVGHRAHRLYFNVIPAATDEDVKDFCAQDTMGFHRIFNRISGNILPGEKLKQCIKTEQQVSGVMLESLRESK